MQMFYLDHFTENNNSFQLKIPPITFAMFFSAPLPVTSLPWLHHKTIPYNFALTTWTNNLVPRVYSSTRKVFSKLKVVLFSNNLFWAKYINLIFIFWWGNAAQFFFSRPHFLYPKFTAKILIPGTKSVPDYLLTLALCSSRSIGHQ